MRRLGVGTLARMADVQPFRAVRYSGAAGSLADLVAPPYDAVGPGEREELRTRSRYNVVHLTLPDSAEKAGELYRAWLSDGILAREKEPATWLLSEEFVGPDDVARERRGAVVSLAAQPYADGLVLPHERTHPRIREDRVRLLRETRAQPEPIFVLVDGPLDVQIPDRAPDSQARGSRLWRLGGFDPGSLESDGLLIADGHHRYESALEVDSGARIMALLVSTADPGLQVFPTHRTFSGRPDLGDVADGERVEDAEAGLVLLASEPRTRSAALVYRRGGVELIRGAEGELDAELVDRYGLDGIGYTPQAGEAVAAVDRGEADVAFLLRAPQVDEIFAAARRGRRMPPKSTYFFPKPLSGLLFHPLDA
jgi:uncharacterized protein (DUF1015 family)